MTLEVTSGVLATLREEAARAFPGECCGLLLGRGERIEAAAPAANVHPDPRTHFEIDPAALIATHRAARAGGAQVIGYFHSHPRGHPRPSAVDCEHSSGDGRAWAVIAGGGGGPPSEELYTVTFWRDGSSGFEPLSYIVRDG